MTKVSEVRSALQYMALVKVVSGAARILNGITGAVKQPLMGIGVGLNR